MFPFKEGDTLYNYCKNGISDENKNRRYCATKVDHRREYPRLWWGWCNDNCPKDPDEGKYVLYVLTSMYVIGQLCSAFFAIGLSHVIKRAVLFRRMQN